VAAASADAKQADQAKKRRALMAPIIDSMPGSWLTRFSAAVFLITAAGSRCSATEFTVQIVDGLSRPISAVHIEVSCVSKEQKETSFRFISDHQGMIRGTYDSAKCTPLAVDISKQGYEPYGTGFRPRYVLRRRFSAQELLRVVRLEGDHQQHDLRELLVGAFEPDEKQFRDTLFYYEAKLRPALRALALDQKISERIRDLLSMIGVSEDLHLIMQLPPPPVSQGFPERWRYSVAASLVSPDNEDEWSFLRRCALHEFDDYWVDLGAIQTLKLTGSPRSQRILEEAQQKNQSQAPRIASALNYIKSNPGEFSHSDLDALARRAGDAINLGKWVGNDSPRFNQSGDKALIDITFKTAMDHLVYTATFHRIGGTWTLRGMRETLQAFAPSELIVSKEIDK
jgi:hypothetical protein